MDRAKKFVLPITFSLSCVFSYYILAFIVKKCADSLNAVIALLLGIIFEFGLPIYLFLIAVPCYCYIYGKKVLLQEKMKYIFTLYNSVIITVLLISILDKIYINFIILFIWTELCSIVPLFINQLNNQNPA